MQKDYSYKGNENSGIINQEQSQSQFSNNDKKKESKPKKSNTLKIVIIVFVVTLVLVLISFGSFFLFFNSVKENINESLGRASDRADDSKRKAYANEIAVTQGKNYDNTGRYAEYDVLKRKYGLEPSVSTYNQGDWNEICCNVSSDGQEWSINVNLKTDTKSFYCSQNGCKSK